MSFPTPYTVKHEVFNGNGINELGNDVEDWSAPVDVNVIAYQSSMVESINGYASRVVSDVDMAVPADLLVTVRDRFQIPGEPGRFEVVFIEDANHGFHGWTPGSVVKLKRVTG